MIDFNSEYNSFSKINKDTYINTIKPVINDESIKNAINCYNEAVKAIKVKNDDIASIQLKKALTYYADFAEAKVLLALYKIKANEIDKAISLLKEVRENHLFAFKASRYLDYITNNKNNKKAVYTKSTTNRRLPSVVSLIICAVIGVIFGFAVGSFTGNDNNVSNDTEQLNKSVIAEKETLLKDTKEELQLAKDSMSTLEKKIKDYETKNKYFNNVGKLLEAENKYLNGKKVEAANLLLDLKSFDFKDQEKLKFDELYELVTNDVSTNLYNEGYGLYDRRKYDEALQKFKESLKYNDIFKYANRSLYYAGRCCQIQGDKISASMYFNELIKNYPNNDYAVYAKKRLNEIS